MAPFVPGGRGLTGFEISDNKPCEAFQSPEKGGGHQYNLIRFTRAHRYGVSSEHTVL